MLDRIVNIIVFESHGRRNIRIGTIICFCFDSVATKFGERKERSEREHGERYPGHGYSRVIRVWSGRTRSSDTGQKRGE